MVASSTRVSAVAVRSSGIGRIHKRRLARPWALNVNPFVVMAPTRRPPPQEFPARVRRVRGRLIGNPGPGPSRPGRPRRAFLGTPSGSLRPFAGLQAALRRPRNGDLCPAANLRPLLPLQARVAMCLIGGRRTPRHCWRATATVAVRPPGSRAIRSPSRRRPLPRETGAWAHPRPVAGGDARSLTRRRGCGDKFRQSSERAALAYPGPRAATPRAQNLRARNERHPGASRTRACEGNRPGPMHLPTSPRAQPALREVCPPRPHLPVRWPGPRPAPG